MLPLQMLSEDARSAFYEALLESLREDARSPHPHLSAQNRSRVESLVSIEELSLDVTHEDFPYGDTRYSCDYTVQGRDASGETVYIYLDELR